MRGVTGRCCGRCEVTDSAACVVWRLERHAVADPVAWRRGKAWQGRCVLSVGRRGRCCLSGEGRSEKEAIYGMVWEGLWGWTVSEVMRCLLCDPRRFAECAVKAEMPEPDSWVQAGLSNGINFPASGCKSVCSTWRSFDRQAISPGTENGSAAHMRLQAQRSPKITIFVGITFFIKLFLRL